MMEKGKTMKHYLDFHEKVKKGEIEPYPMEKINLLRIESKKELPKDLYLLDLETPAGKFKITSISNIHMGNIAEFMPDAEDREQVEDTIAEVVDEPPFSEWLNRTEIMKVASLAADLQNIPEEHHPGIIAGIIRHDFKENPHRFLLMLRLVAEHIRPEL